MQLLLIAILGVATLTLVGMGLAQWHRRVSRMQAAGECNLKFSSQDIFDVTRRYAGFALMQAGHSAYADNVIYGHLGGWFVRAFDCHFEAGHGPHRVTRRYSVVAAETQLRLPDASAWRDVELDSPAALLPATTSLAGGWRTAGDADAAEKLARCWLEQGSQAVWIQACEGVVLFVTPGRLGRGRLGRQLRATTEGLSRLAELAGAGPA